MSEKIHFHGNLLFFVNKGHGYMQGMPWVGNAQRKPRIVLQLGAASVSTKRWEGTGEATWKECFRIAVDCDGTELFTASTYLTLDSGEERKLTAFTIELATLLSHVGPQWHQFRSLDPQPGAASAIRAEIQCEVRWFPVGFEIPPAFIRAVSASADTSPNSAAAGSPSASSTEPLSSPKDKPSGSVEKQHRLSVPGADFTSRTAHSDSASRSDSHSNSNSRARSPSLSPPSPPSSLPQSTSSPALSTQPQAKQQADMPRADSIPTAYLSLFPSQSPTSESAFLTLEDTPVNGSPMPAVPLPANLPHVFSSSIHGRLLPDTQAFDDRNFLEHAAAVAHITELLIWGDTAITALQFIYTLHGHRVQGNRHGQPHSSPSVLTLRPGEFITAIGGRRSEDGIKSLTVVTNRQRRMFGASDGVRTGLEIGEDFVCQAPKGSRVVCMLGGWNRKGINNIGICFAKHDSQSAADAAGYERKEGERETAPRGALTKQRTPRHI